MAKLQLSALTPPCGKQNHYRLIAYPVFSRHKLYIKALLSHKEYDRKDWENKWP